MKRTKKKLKITPNMSIGGYNNMTIGYFGRPGFDGGLTHFVENSKPICNTFLPKDSQFQWCIPNAKFVSYRHRVECEKCSKIQKKYLLTMGAG